MVEKPEEGICSRCDSENLEFYDDGSGRCLDCGRAFRWASKEELSQQKSDVDRSAQTEQTTSTSERPPDSTRRSQPQQMSGSQTTGVSRTNGTAPSRNGYTPSQKTGAIEEPKGRGFLWLGVVGLVLMMVGYVLASLFTMEVGLEEHREIIRGSYLLLTSVGVLMAGLGMLVFGSVADHLDEHIRKGLIMAAALLIALYLGFGQLSFFVF